MLKDASKNGGVRTSENPLPHKSNENTGKMVRISFFRTEKNQRLATILGIFIQENLLNLGKNSELCGVLTCSIHMLSSPAPW